MTKQIWGSTIGKFRIPGLRDLRISPTEPGSVSRSQLRILLSHLPWLLLKNRDVNNCTYIAFEDVKARTES